MFQSKAEWGMKCYPVRPCYRGIVRLSVRMVYSLSFRPLTFQFPFDKCFEICLSDHHVHT